MKNNFSLKFTLFDAFIGAISLILILAVIISTNIVYGRNKDNKRVEMYLNGELLEDYVVDFKDVSERITITIQKEEFPNSPLLGDLKVDIDPEKGIRVYDVTCPNHVCENLGWIRTVGFSITCIPNGFFVVIKSYDIDYDIGLG